jgi:hypothetical protein
MENLRWMAHMGGAVSVTGSAFIIGSFALFHRLRASLSFRLIVALTVADGMRGVAHLIDFVRVTPESCSSQAGHTAGLLHVYFTMASFLWVATICRNIKLVVVNGRNTELEGHELWFHGFCWAAPLIPTGLAAVTNCVGDAGNWSSLKANPRCDAERFWLQYSVSACLFIYCIVSFGEILRTTRQLSGFGVRSVVKRRLAAYVLVYIATQSFAFVNRVSMLASGGRASYALFWLHSLATPLTGACNALVYGVNRQVLTEWRGWLGGGAYRTLGASTSYGPYAGRASNASVGAYGFRRDDGSYRESYDSGDGEQTSAYEAPRLDEGAGEQPSGEGPKPSAEDGGASSLL